VRSRRSCFIDTRPLRVDEELWPEAGRRSGAELVVDPEWRLDVLVPDV
jgi:hypothetical protein